jgi:hypothetical protein
MNAPERVDFQMKQDSKAISVHPVDGIRSMELYCTGGQMIARSLTEYMTISSLNKGLYILNVSDLPGNRKSFKVIIK